MAASDKAKRIAMLMVGAPGGASRGGAPRGSGDAVDDTDAPPDDGEGDGDLEEAMGALRDAMRGGDDAAAAAAFRAAVQAVG